MPTIFPSTRVGALALACCMSIPLGGCFSFGMSVDVPVDPPPPETAVGDTPPTEPLEICEVGQYRVCSSRCIVGNGPSCNNLGAMYELGLVVPRDVGHALELYDRACAAGADAGCVNAKKLRGASSPAAPVESPP